MKTTRRTFLGIIGAAALTVSDAFGFFQKKKYAGAIERLRHETGLAQGEPHKSVAYVYNAGMDFDVRDHTFGQIPMIPGGKVTRIVQCEEWTARSIHDWEDAGRPVYTQPGRFGRIFGMKPRLTGWKTSEGEQKRAAGLYRTEKIVVGHRAMLSWMTRKHLDRMIPDPRESEPIYEDRFVIVHPALEIARNLSEYSQQQIVVLEFWNGKEVDTDWINRLIAADTLLRRIEKVSALRANKELSLLKLRATLLPVLGMYAARLRKQLAQNIATTNRPSPFEIQACKLLDIKTEQAAHLRQPEIMVTAWDSTSKVTHRELDAAVAWIEQGIPLWSV